MLAKHEIGRTEYDQHVIDVTMNIMTIVPIFFNGHKEGIVLIEFTKKKKKKKRVTSACSQQYNLKESHINYEKIYGT